MKLLATSLRRFGGAGLVVPQDPKHLEGDVIASSLVVDHYMGCQRSRLAANPEHDLRKKVWATCFAPWRCRSRILVCGSPTESGRARLRGAVWYFRRRCDHVGGKEPVPELGRAEVWIGTQAQA